MDFYSTIFEALFQWFVRHANEINTVLDSVKNREIAFSIWIGGLLLLAVLKSDIGKPIGGLIKLLFGKHIRGILLILILYLLVLITIFSKAGVWDLSLLKVTVVWYFTVVAALFLKVSDATDAKFFLGFAKKSLTLTIAIPFIINFYAFSFTVEMFIAPCVLLFAAMKAYVEVLKKDEEVGKISSVILNIIGWVYVIFAVYKMVTNYNEVFSLHSLNEMLLPPILTLLFLPLMYCIALWIHYSTTFSCLNYTTKEASQRRLLKRTIIRTAGLRLNQIVNIQKVIIWCEPP